MGVATFVGGAAALGSNFALALGVHASKTAVGRPAASTLVAATLVTATALVTTALVAATTLVAATLITLIRSHSLLLNEWNE